MKKAIILFWKGLTGIIAATAEWFTVILGMKDESKYGKFIRRVVGGCFAFIMFVFACAGANALYEFVCKESVTAWGRLLPNAINIRFCLF